MAAGEDLGLQVKTVDAALRAFTRDGPMFIADQDLPDGQRPTLFWAPGLTAKPWWPADPLARLEGSWRTILDEFNQLRASGAAPEQIRGGSIQGDWCVWQLLDEGVWRDDNCELCPQTTELLKALPVCDSALGYVYFSVLGAETFVAPHHGATNAKLRAHLALDVAAEAGLRVDQTIQQWETGKAVLFDDSYEHMVWNSASDRERVVLLVDLWHPELCTQEVVKLRRFFGSEKASNNLQALLSQPGLLLMVARWLPTSSFWALGLSCKRLHRVWLDEDEWKTRTLQDYSVTEPHSSCDDSWRSTYRYEATAKFLACPEELLPTPGSLGALELCKMLMVGDCCVGKTSFMFRLMRDEFSPEFRTTIGIDFLVRPVSVSPEGPYVKLQCWDIAGPERFRSISRAYYRNQNVIFLCYDITCIRSFDACESYLEAVLENIDRHQIIIALVGCKCDLEERREVSRDDATMWMQRMCEQHGLVDQMFFQETSSKTGLNVERAAVTAVRSWIRNTWTPPEHELEPTTVQKPSEDASACNRCVVS